MDPIRLGVVGVGTLSLRVLPHLACEDVQDSVQVAALADPVTERVAATAKEYGVPAHFASIDEMLDADAVDAVMIASPIGLHYEQGLKALQAGKSVHFNKTMCTTVDEADELIATAARTGAKIVASPNDVLLPQTTRIRQLIEEGAIGTFCWALCGAGFGQYHERETERQSAPGGLPINPSWYFRNPGGGPMYDMTVYSLHGLTSVLGPAKSVTALSGVALTQREFMGVSVESTADDNTIVLIDFGNSRFAVAYGTPAGVPGGTRYLGSAGTIEGLKLNGEPFDFDGKAYVDANPHDGAASKRTLPHLSGKHLELGEPHVFEDVMQMVDWARLGRPSRVTAEHARHVIDIIESGFRAAQTGQAQQLRTTFELAPLP